MTRKLRESRRRRLNRHAAREHAKLCVCVAEFASMGYSIAAPVMWEDVVPQHLRRRRRTLPKE